MSCPLKFGAVTAEKRLAEKPPLIHSDDEDNAVTDTVFTHSLTASPRPTESVASFNSIGMDFE